jgi:hypothetical protein
MRKQTTGAVRVKSRPQAFGPARQSFEIENASKKTVTVHLERAGSECFQIPGSSRKLTVKPGRSVRAHVEFTPPAGRMVIALRATYRAAIKVWVRAHRAGMKDRLIDLVELTGTGPGVVSRADLRCFDPAEAAGPKKAGRSAR